MEMYGQEIGIIAAYSHQHAFDSNLQEIENTRHGLEARLLVVVCPVSKSRGMKPIMYANPQERLLDEKTLPVVVQELKQRATLGLASDSIVCDLSSATFAGWLANFWTPWTT